MSSLRERFAAMSPEGERALKAAKELVETGDLDTSIRRLEEMNGDHLPENDKILLDEVFSILQGVESKDEALKEFEKYMKALEK